MTAKLFAIYFSFCLLFRNIFSMSILIFHRFKIWDFFVMIICCSRTWTSDIEFERIPMNGLSSLTQGPKKGYPISKVSKTDAYQLSPLSFEGLPVPLSYMASCHLIDMHKIIYYALYTVGLSTAISLLPLSPTARSWARKANLKRIVRKMYMKDIFSVCDLWPNHDHQAPASVEGLTTETSPSHLASQPDTSTRHNIAMCKSSTWQCDTIWFFQPSKQVVPKVLFVWEGRAATRSPRLCCCQEGKGF